MRLVFFLSMLGFMPVVCADPLGVEGISEDKFIKASEEALCTLLADCDFFSSSEECLDSMVTDSEQFCNFDAQAASDCLDEIETITCDDVMAGATATLMPSCALVSGC